jgi:DNA polymerase-3 subunit alpha
MTLADIQPLKSLPFHGVIMPAITIEPAHLAAAGAAADCGNAAFLKQLCRAGFKTKLSHLDAAQRKVYGERVTFELDTIETLGFTNYILMVWDICRFADEKGIPRGPGRGSVGSSLVSYLIGITELDPIVNGLFFTRFLSKARAKKTVVDGITYVDGGLVPDIDCDFSFYRREEVITYLDQRYPYQTSKLLTTTTFTSKILLKDVLKTYEGGDERAANDASDLVDKQHGIPQELEDAMGLNAVENAKAEAAKKTAPENKRLIEWAEYHKDTVAIAMALTGLNRSEGQHASAVLICEKAIRDLMPMQLSSEKDGVKELVSAFDMYSAQEITIKMDILGLRTLDVIDEACRLIGIKRHDIDVNHPSIYAQLQDFKHRYGIFQLETFAQGTAATKVKPKDFDQLSAVLAIARPGAIAYLDQFAKYVNRGEYTPIDPLIDEILKPTGGVCVYQEQLLAMVNRLGMDLDECEGLRKAIGKKLPEKVAEYKVKIYAIAEKNGHRKELADLIWKIAEDSAGYQFNKSHSACYGMITAYTLYLKANHPLQFYWALLKMSRHEADGHTVIAEIEKEMRARGFTLLPPHLIKSDLDFKIEDDKSIRYSLGMIRGVSEKSMAKLQSFRDDANAGGNLFQVFQSIKNAGLNIGVASALIQAGCLEGYGVDRTRLVLCVQTWNLLSDKEKSICLTIGHLPEVNWDVLNAIYYLSTHNDDAGKPLLKPSRFETIKKKYQPYKEIWELNRRNPRLANFFYERTVLGYSYSENVRSIFDGDNTGLSSIHDVCEMGEDSKVRFIGFVKEDPYRSKTKAGNDQIKMDIVDETGECGVRFFNARIAMCEKLNGRLPVCDDLAIITGTKKEGAMVFADAIGLQTATIYMKLRDLKDAAAKKAEKAEAAATPAASEAPTEVAA